MHQKGYVIYCPGSRSIVVSDEVIFDELFTSAIALTWQKFQDVLTLRPLASFIPDVRTTLERTGTIATLHPQVEEGTTAVEESTPVEEGHNPDSNDPDDLPDLVPQQPEDDESTAASNDESHNEFDDSNHCVGAPDPANLTPSMLLLHRRFPGKTFVMTLTYKRLVLSRPILRPCLLSTT